MRYVIIAVVLSFFACHQPVKNTGNNYPAATPQTKIVSLTNFDKKSWPYFLQHLPIINGPVLDYNANPVAFQQKHVAIVNYDVGKSDLQQCADALIRLRAEYLFEQHRYSEIGFHFVNDKFYSWDEYCKGIKVFPKGNDVEFINTAPSFYTHQSLRKYLDIVYTYASTISLAKELKKANDFGIGTVVIHPGSPGHCFIIIDEANDSKGEKVFKLAEGYSPAQSIYVLRNLEEEKISPWYHLHNGTITTASCRFIDYELKSFE